MFNTFCYYPNFIHPRIPAALRWAAFMTLTRRAWRYSTPQAGYKGGVDTALGTVAFEDEGGKLRFIW